MLKSWSIENFKPIVNSGELKLAPVTILAGQNSSGKSSLLQSILMISQTLSSRVLDRPLLPNGPIVQLGTFEDILNEMSDSHILTVGFELMFEGVIIQSAKVIAKFSSVSDNGASSSAIEAAKVAVDSVLIEGNAESKDLPIRPLFDSSKFVEPTHPYINFSIKKISDTDFRQFSKNIAPEYLDLLPYLHTQSNYLGVLELQRTTFGPYLVALSHFLPTRLVQKFEEKENREQELPDNSKDNGEGLETVYFDVAHEQLMEQITRFFSSKIRYLGPLRVDPWATQQRFAPTGELDEVGAKGEYAAMVYQGNQNAPIEWYNPQTRQVEQGTLQDALDIWACHLGVANQIRTETAGLSGVTWKVVLKQGQKARSLQEVGVGVSQVLPILVMGLLAPSNALLIMEQPELHLHPSVQARLGDFFVGLSRCNKQCLIETHSENLVSQLRYHIVLSGGQDKSDCIIYFVNQDEKGAARFEPIEISPQGNILNWPDGFFDETMLQEDRITAASIKRRATKAKNG